MSIEYRVDNVRYTLSYSQLKSEHEKLCSLSDEEFRRKLPEAIHLACIISYLKELPSDVILSDRGVIHLLAHQLHIPEDFEVLSEFSEMREKFKSVLALS